MKFAPALAAALFAVLAAACSQAGADPAFGAKVRAYLLEHPEVLEEALTKLEEKRVAAQLAKAQAGLSRERSALERDARDPAVGPRDAKLVVVEFADYRCGFCKLAAPEIAKLAAEHPDVRFVFKELPIFGEVSEYAARAALVAARDGKYMPVHQAFMAEKNLDRAAVDRILSANGIDPVRARTLGSAPEIDAYIRDQQALAERIGVQGTPAFIIGDVMVPGADMAAVRRAIDQARKKSTRAT